MKTFNELKISDPTVYSILSMGGGLVDCICALADEKERLFNRIIELELIAPKKIQTADGKEFVWNCPPDLIPTVKIL